MIKKIKKYPPLMDIRTIESLLLLGEIINKGFVYANTIKISDEEYIEMIKMAVEGEVYETTKGGKR